ncbi:bacterio-opsin activator domain-containing protein [Halorussus sp. MSC15.2]|uniref:helix-turn-helix domain-containing protein n=1 Tax=Halorussus sp. MSC15.2 TaxID=2283638 RepID=UPI0013D75128|nr:bacterio-opsin activator domain-containing protein [Halorussus sp. MSC15.2]NEU58065.1 bacterio-opsin activator [Halorussus sp. MSC15.2]
MSETPTDSVVELEFRITDSRYPLVSIPERTGCRANVEEIVPRGNDTYAVFYQIVGATQDVVELVNEHENIEARRVSGRESDGVVEVLVTSPDEHFVVALTDAGAIPREIRSADGVAKIVAEVPAMYQVSTVVDRFLSVHPTVEVVACRQKDRTSPMFTRREFETIVEERLTPRQREVLRAAFDEGYFDWPRGKSGEEIAEDLGIANTTFSQHLRTAERKLLSIFFDEK